MPETIHDKKIFSLEEVTLSIKKTLNERYRQSFWVKAEMNKLNHYPYSGHCYPELVQKKDGKIIAEIKSILWKDDYYRVNQLFLKILKEPLKDGIGILFCASISFDPVYGLSLRILDIDPSYSLGEIQREKQDTIDRLKKESLFDSNKSLQVPMLPKRIAIISVGTSKGFADFQKMISSNPRGYQFFQMLFPAVLQGSQAVPSIVKQLSRIRQVKDHFDVVAIVRGGGGDIGLTCYNHFDLAKEICRFPLPVITGIGHATNETVCEMVSCKNAITPTDLAGFLIQKFYDFNEPLEKSYRILEQEFGRSMKESQMLLFNTIRFFMSVTGSMLLNRHREIENNLRSFRQSSSFYLQQQKVIQRLIISGMNRNSGLILNRRKQLIRQMALMLQKDVASALNSSRWMVDRTLKQVSHASDNCFSSSRQRMNAVAASLSGKTLDQLRRIDTELDNTEKMIGMVDPDHVIKRGYSITTVKGQVLKSKTQVSEGDLLSTMITDGIVISEVKKILKLNGNG